MRLLMSFASWTIGLVSILGAQQARVLLQICLLKWSSEYYLTRVQFVLDSYMLLLEWPVMVVWACLGTYLLSTKDAVACRETSEGFASFHNYAVLICML